MKSSLSKIIKFLIVAGLIGGLVFLGVKFLFPAPKTDLAYNTSLSLQENKKLERLQEVNDRSVLAFAGLIITGQNINPSYYQSIQAMEYGYETILLMQEFMTTELAFATNNSHYNSYVKKAAAAYKKLEKNLDAVISYIDNNLTLFLATPGLVNEVVASTYAKALYELNVDVFKSITELNHNIVEIYSNLKTTLINNEFARALIKTQNTWLEVLSGKLNKDVIEGAAALNSSALAGFNFATEKLTKTFVKTFYSYNSTAKETLSSLLKADVKGLLGVFKTGAETSFIDSIENQEVKNATAVFYDMIKGE